MSEHKQEADGVQRNQADNDDDNAPMVYRTPHDYASWATKEREVLHNQGKEVILQSELPSMISRLKDESDADYVERYCDYTNDLIRRGVYILNDKITHDVVPDLFNIEGHSFDVGPKSGITKKEYREFSDWMGKEDISYADMPERFLRFEATQTSSTSPSSSM